jgi:hypothetical protein
MHFPHSATASPGGLPDLSRAAFTAAVRAEKIIAGQAGRPNFARGRARRAGGRALAYPPYTQVQRRCRPAEPL